MRAVRQVQPLARLIQTEDLGKTFSTPTIRYQADFENTRRWLSFDLLCGKVDRHHPIGEYLRWLGVEEQNLRWFEDNPCPPDILGINYYVTSERYLDEHADNYPQDRWGGNGRHVYVDLEAVRARPQGLAGLRRLLQEAWERYRIPLAVTEAHLGCSRDEQLRWLWEVWQQADSARRAGADVRAVTLWALLGSYDWDSLVTKQRGHYEPGAFDVRSGTPRPTAVAKLAQTLAKNEEPRLAVLSQPGWWRRPERFLHAPCGRAAGTRFAKATGDPVLITGATGTLGQAFARLCEAQHIPHCLLTRQEVDVANAESVAAALSRTHPWAIINAAGYVRVDDAEKDAERCRRENTVGPVVLAAACAEFDIPLVTFSSDLVFDGRERRPYRESDLPNPLGVYGQTKAEAERQVLATHKKSLVIRTSAFFSPSDEHNFVTVVLRELLANRTFIAANDAVVSPTYVPDLTKACLDLLLDGAYGIWHLANRGETTWAELARNAAQRAGLNVNAIRPMPSHALSCRAARPLYSVLGSERGLLLPCLDDALGRYFAERRANHKPDVPIGIPA